MACTLVKQNCRCSYLQQDVRGVVNTHDQTSHTQHVIYIREADQAYGGQMMNEHNEEILQAHKTYVKRGLNTKILCKINTKSETFFSLTGSQCKHKQDLRSPDWLNKEEHYICVMIALCILIYKSLGKEWYCCGLYLIQIDEPHPEDGHPSETEGLFVYASG